MPSRPIRNGLAHLGSTSLCSVQQPACVVRRTVCRLRAVTAAVTYVTQPISWKPQKSSGVLCYASRLFCPRRCNVDLGLELGSVHSEETPNRWFILIDESQRKRIHGVSTKIEEKNLTFHFVRRSVERKKKNLCHFESASCFDYL